MKECGCFLKSGAPLFKWMLLLSGLMLLCSISLADWYIDTVNAAGDMGMHSDIALDSFDRPHISYYGATNGDLKYAHWTGTDWDIVTIDSGDDVGQYTSIALDSLNMPHISYYDATNTSLKYARKDSVSGKFSYTTVDTEDRAGQCTSIALDINIPHISYFTDNGSKGKIKYATKPGDTWIIETVDTDLGWHNNGYTSIALDSNKKPHIAFFESPGSSDYLKYAKKPDATWLVETVDQDLLTYQATGYYPSLALNSNNYPRISYWFGYQVVTDWGWDVRYASWDGSKWNIVTIPVSLLGNVGYTSLALSNTLDLPTIAFANDRAGNLHYATKPLFGSWNVSDVDSSGDVGNECAHALDSQSYAHISYYDATNGDLKYARYNPNPTLSWTGERGYLNDGLDPETGEPLATTFIYKVKYKDKDNEPPEDKYPKVHIQKGGVDITSSPFSMTYDSGDYETGAIYTFTRQFTPGEDYSYFFEAYDEWGAPATGDPTKTIDAPDVPNTTPTLSFTGEIGFESDGLEPDEGTTESLYVYKIKYTDPDNDMPKIGYPKVHIFKGGEELSWSPGIMIRESGEYNTGAIYYMNTALLELGDDYSYSFEARDKWDWTSNELSGSGPGVVKPTPTPYNEPPVIQITSPASLEEPTTNTFIITWTDSDPDSSALISLHYNTLTSGTEGMFIAGGIEEDDETDRYSWNTSEVPEGIYWIYSIINDGINPAVPVYSPGSVKVTKVKKDDMVNHILARRPGGIKPEKFPFYDLNNDGRINIADIIVYLGLQ